MKKVDKYRGRYKMLFIKFLGFKMKRCDFHLWGDFPMRAYFPLRGLECKQPKTVAKSKLYLYYLPKYTKMFMVGLHLKRCRSLRIAGIVCSISNSRNVELMKTFLQHEQDKLILCSTYIIRLDKHLCSILKFKSIFWKEKKLKGKPFVIAFNKIRWVDSLSSFLKIVIAIFKF